MAEEQGVGVGRGSLGEALGAALGASLTSPPKEAPKEEQAGAPAEAKPTSEESAAAAKPPAAQGQRPPREGGAREGGPREGGKAASGQGGNRGPNPNQGNRNREARPPREGGAPREGGNREGGNRPQGGGERREGGPRPQGDRRDFRPGGERRDFAPEIEIDKLIGDSLYLDNQAHIVVSRMRDLDSGTRSQLGRFYNAVRRATRAPENERQHEFVMLRARLAYTIARHGLRSLDQLERLLLQVTRRNEARGYERFRDLFEAIVAYNE
jgi:CRISPR type III-A-associated protein Csm2